MRLQPLRDPRLALSLMLSLIAVVAAERPLDERAARPDEWGYRPADGARVALNPPSFTWIAPADAVAYDVEWSADPAFPAVGTTTAASVVWPTYTHDAPLAAGTHHWRYRARDARGDATAWSRARRVEVPAAAAILPLPGRAEQRARVPAGHPRLFLRPEDLPRLRELVRGPEAPALAELRAAAERYLAAGPTPEPPHKGSARDKTNAELIKYWWPNRVQVEQACTEAETLAFVYLLTGERRFGEGARRWLLHLAAWDPQGTTNFTLNCEAGKPLLHRPARAYDWAWDVFTSEERGRVQATMRTRVLEAWNSGEVARGVGHLQRPYGSHANRVWHKLAEAGIAFLDEIPEAPQWLDYALNKFYSCYPVWSDDDGGWHEGVSYWSSYQSKAVGWLQVAQTALRIDGLRKPFFAQVGDYPLYLAPPHSPNSGFGDLSFRPLDAPAFLEYHVRARAASGDGGNAAYWAWWAREKRQPANGGIIGLLYRANLPAPASPRPPADLPASKVFRGIGVASLHTTLLDSREDVHFAFKASPFGSQSHGHNPQNSFFLNAYGEALLVANGYRDLHGSAFHTGHVHQTRAHNAVLVNGEGQIPHTARATGAFVRADLVSGRDILVGDATPAYGGRLRKAWRHVVFVKGPDPFVVYYDELVAPAPATFQFLLHAPRPFAVEAGDASARVEQPRAALSVRYLSPLPLAFRQTDGFEPPPTREFPNLWHLEAATSERRAELGMVTVLVPERAGRPVAWSARREDRPDRVRVEVTVAGRRHTLEFPAPGTDRPVTLHPEP
jgi:hypothetical protein